MVKLFYDGADLNSIIDASKNKNIKGFTTNPTLMKQAGITDYTKFSKDVIQYLSLNRQDTCISLEVFADDYDNIYKQAMLISKWGEDFKYPVYVKIPVMYTNGNNTYDLIKKLSDENIKLNITAVFTFQQIINICSSLNKNTNSIISIFAGRISDVGYDAERIVKFAVEIKNYMTEGTKWQTLWASSREAYNYVQAEQCGCDIITMTPDLIKKIEKFGKDLNQFSLETCQMFYNDAKASGYTL